MSSKNKKETRGGKRPRSGRPAVDYQTTTIAFRVRVEHADAIRQAVKELQRKLIATPLQK
jgi:hypothetical protein